EPSEIGRAAPAQNQVNRLPVTRAQDRSRMGTVSASPQPSWLSADQAASGRQFNGGTISRAEPRNYQAAPQEVPRYAPSAAPNYAPQRAYSAPAPNYAPQRSYSPPAWSSAPPPAPSYQARPAPAAPPVPSAPAPASHNSSPQATGRNSR